MVNEINEAGGRETIRLVEANGGRAAFFLADVGDEQAVRALIQFVETTYGGPDILINNASAPYGPQGPLDHWFDAIQVDLLARCRELSRHRVDTAARGRSHCEHRLDFRDRAWPEVFEIDRL
ncbi:MAG: hypothetical protein AUI36_17450 [Cyanobacteria bacterium 13_1_40CM_2_61_4]|nr:MAG: hypothetical protein AUI36_17450 [Cyanobacteria bacterium 13_1_40CM_2_61_4]